MARGVKSPERGSSRRPNPARVLTSQRFDVLTTIGRADLPVGHHHVLKSQGFDVLTSSYSCPSTRCLEASALQFSAKGSGVGSRCTLATASSVFCTASPRHPASVAASAQPCCNRYSSQTFRQSRPVSEFFNFAST